MSAADLQDAIKAAERLTRTLRDINSGDNDWLAGALTDIDRLTAARADLDARYRQWLADQIDTAAGNAAAHTWRVSDGGTSLQCADCAVSALPPSLRSGQTPPCPEQCPRFTTGMPHSIYSNYDADSSVCIYCKTEYPSTANVLPGTREGVPTK